MTVTISIFINHYLENWFSIRLHYLKLTSFGHIRTFQPFIIEFQAICIQDHAKWRHKEVTWPKMTVKLAEKLKIAIRMLFLEFYYSSSNKNSNICNTIWIEKREFFILYITFCGEFYQPLWVLSNFEAYSLSVHVRLVISQPQLGMQLACWEKND